MQNYSITIEAAASILVIAVIWFGQWNQKRKNGRHSDLSLTWSEALAD